MTFALREALLQPAGVPALDNEQLHVVVAQARGTRLLAALAVELSRAGVLDDLAPQVKRHLDSALLTHHKQRRDLAYDAGLVGEALAGAGIPLVLLKGGAYMLADLPVGEGRLITDIDIIVPKAQLPDAERALHAGGWDAPEISDYDASYYRRWSHEIPALYNHQRNTTLDVHHNILPPTAAPNIRAPLLFEALQEVAPGIHTLCRADMVIHSATHLFQEGEFHHGLRDLWDLHQMLRDFPASDVMFWDSLVERATALELLPFLWHGLNYTRLVFDTVVPEAVLVRVGGTLQRARQPLMTFLYRRALRPNHPESRLPFTNAALYALYVRSHYLRMPLYLLLPHLARKARMRSGKQGDLDPGGDA